MCGGGARAPAGTLVSVHQWACSWNLFGLSRKTRVDKAVGKSRYPSVPLLGTCFPVLKLVCLQPFLSKLSLGSFSLAHEPLLLL